MEEENLELSKVIGKQVSQPGDKQMRNTSGKANE